MEILDSSDEKYKTGFSMKDFNCRDPLTYNHIIIFLEKTFSGNSEELKKVKELAQKIKTGIERISPFIQENTKTVCPHCRDVCCTGKHGYYNFEDLVYLYSLGLKPPHYGFVKKDSDPCQYLSETGCSMERSIRPSGCNWYFCDSLLDRMEKSAEYLNFDDEMRELAELWLSMMEEFNNSNNSPSPLLI
jgi:hypothetical protein